MRKYFPIILITLLVISILTGFMAGNNISKQNNISSTNRPVSMSKSAEVPDNSFSKEDYQKLLDLQFYGYEDMTISDYQRHVAKLTDTAKYNDLLERFLKSEILYKQKDTDKTAAFLFYILPLTTDEGKIRNYSGYVTSSYPKDNARLEYSFTLTILDADTLTIREYNTTRLNIISGMHDILNKKTIEKLQNTNSMLTDIQNNIDNLIKQLQTEKIKIFIEFAYFPVPVQGADKENEQQQDSDEWETRKYSNGTKEDYSSLLALKTRNYQNMPLADFNSALLEWTNEDRKRLERIEEDTKWNDFQVPLTAKELSFLKLTVFLSGMENGKKIQSIYTGTQPDNPYYGEYLPKKTVNENRAAPWCSLYYQFSYSVLETKKVTVGERDRQIESVINAIQAFWSDIDVENLLEMSENDIVKELEKIAAIYSTDNIRITIDKEQLHFERMDERKYTK